MAKPLKVASTLLLILSLCLLSATLAFSHHQREDPERQLQQCLERCTQTRQEQRHCESQCREKYEEQGREQEEGGRGGEEGRGNEQESQSPYIYEEQRFKERVRTEGGWVRVSERFGKRSDLLWGVANYRVGVMEVNPYSYVVPNHWDADAVFFVARGRATVNLLEEDNRESVEIRRGDILRIPAGTTFSIINKENNEKLRIIKFFNPVAVPGRYRAYFGPGGRDPESFFWSFSHETTSAAFGTPWERLRQIFERQDKGAIIKASQQQIQEIGRHSSEGGSWPFGRGSGQRHQSFNLFKKRATHSSNRGQLFEADRHDYEHLRDLDLKVSYTNISGGSMTAPFYNSRVTKLAFIVNGEGYVEMACPHLATRSGGGEQQRETERGQRGEEEEEEEEQTRRGEEGREEEEGRVRYQKVRARLRRNTLFVAPAGHPTVIVSTGNDNLEVLCFEVNAEGNQRYYLTGKNSIYNQMDDTELELAFNQPAREPKQIFRQQRELILLKGPEGREEEEGRRGPLDSILDFAGF
ncbi:hypothetical protein H6P81_004858 [Aristolochia fimbriata]|uniref:Cupin type-1 domain-containing protein n=1 Tax=Aristolochia fimbriata TaxID=158543 RepID=A0AAV7ETT0_ARIFI|nr:hypothetical protein H6P81_004858 [Aristolochia fimbriata]